MISKKILLLVGISIVVIASILLSSGLELNDAQDTSPEVVAPLVQDEPISIIDKLKFTDKSVLVVAPLLTANAYAEPGFYTYFRGECDESCISVQIDGKVPFRYTSSNNALVFFINLGIPLIDDYTASLNPEILDEYEKIIMLHNEYVTIEFYETIIKHQNVYFMYPNALYAEIELVDGVMTLIRGHDFPPGAELCEGNGFCWEFENTRPDEYDLECIDFEWRQIDNGYQLNCYPEVVIFEKPEIADFIFEDR